MIPQSLAFQQETPPQSRFGTGADISVTFNTNYKNLNMIPNLNSIPQNQVDFEFFAAHEIIHGLGIGQSVYYFYRKGIPRLTTKGLKPLYRNYQGSAAISKFSSFIHHESESFQDIVNDFVVLNNRQLSTFWKLMLKAEKLYKFATSDNVYALLPDSTKIKLYTNQTYLPSSSLNHLSMDYFNSSDFLMVPRLGWGQTLNSKMKKFNSTSLFGPNTRKLLEAIGWATKENPKPIKFINLY